MFKLISHFITANQKLFLMSTNFFPSRDIWKKIDFFKSSKLLKSYGNVYRKSSAKRECHGENVFLKADRVLSKLNFLFYL